MRLNKKLKRLLILLLVFAWLLTGWPQIFNFPPKIPEAKAAISEATASADTTLSATTYMLVDSMTLTPGAGDYLAVFNMGVLYPATAGGEFLRVSIFVNGVQQTHTEREIFAETSLDAALIPIATSAHISVGAGQTVEVRYLKTGTGNFTGKNRRLILFPKASADFSQATATADTTKASGGSYALLDSMILTPGAGDYLAVFTTSGDGVSGARPAYSLFVGGTQVAHTERTFTMESSIANTEFAVLIAAKVSPTAGQAVEVRWVGQVGTGNITAHERTLTLMKVDSADIFEASATADASATNTTDAAINSLSVTPGVAAEYLAIFSGSDFYGTIGANVTTTYSIYKDSTQATDSELAAMHEASVDSADMAVFDAATVNITSAQAVTAQWRGSSATSRTIHERTLVLIKEEPATFEQSAYRLFNNANSTDVGTALAVQDTAATLGSAGAAFRLRMLLHVDTAQLALNGQNFKLQFAQQSGTCDTGFVGETYADVTAATVIAYNNNATPADGDNLTANANDPTHGADTIVNQDYEELNNFTNTVAAIPAAQDGKWDFSLKDNGATANTAYCLRAVKSDATVLNTYTVIPQITTAAAGPTNDQRMWHGKWFSGGAEQPMQK